MNKGLIFGLGVTAGLGAGGLLVNTLLKQQYEQKADEQIAACREAFLAELAKLRKELEEKQMAEKKEAAVDAIRKYSSEPEKAEQTIREADKPKDKPPYEISEAIFDDPGNPYKTEGIWYFPDKNVLMREDQTIMNKEDVEIAIGIKSLALFDDNETDRIIIRNDKFQKDYEINMVSLGYEEWLKKHRLSGK